MNTFIRLAAATWLAGLTLTATPADAGTDAVQSRIVIDCDQPGLPTQREVGHLLGQHNAAQVYASRAALMANARRACLRGRPRVRHVAFEAPSVRPAPSTVPSTAPPPEHRVAEQRHGP